MRALMIAIVVMLAPGALAWAQAPPGRGAGQPSPAPTAPPAANPPATTQPAAPAPPAGGGFTYNPEGRRDPFVSLVRRGGGLVGTSTTGARPAGLAGLDTSEVTLKGTVQSQTGFVGILQGPDNKTSSVRPGDKLFDGPVRSIAQNVLVILQQVNDPLSLEKQREVRKVLRQTDEAK